MPYSTKLQKKRPLSDKTSVIWAFLHLLSDKTSKIFLLSDEIAYLYRKMEVYDQETDDKQYL